MLIVERFTNIQSQIWGHKMLYAKVDGDSLFIFPYTPQNLKDENNQTNYDDRFDLAGWYKQTEEALKTSYLVVEVNFLDKPNFDEQTQYLKLKFRKFIKIIISIIRYAK